MLFDEDKNKIERCVRYYPMGSYQVGEIARLSALLYEKGINVVEQLEKLCVKYKVDI